LALPERRQQLALLLRRQQVGGEDGGVRGRFHDRSRPRRRLALATLSLHRPSFPSLVLSRAHVAACRCRPPAPSRRRPTAQATRREWEGGDGSPGQHYTFRTIAVVFSVSRRIRRLPLRFVPEKNKRPGGEPIPGRFPPGMDQIPKHSEEL